MEILVTCDAFKALIWPFIILFIFSINLLFCVIKSPKARETQFKAMFSRESSQAGTTDCLAFFLDWLLKQTLLNIAADLIFCESTNGLNWLIISVVIINVIKAVLEQQPIYSLDVSFLGLCIKKRPFSLIFLGYFRTCWWSESCVRSLNEAYFCRKTLNTSDTPLDFAQFMTKYWSKKYHQYCLSQYAKACSIWWCLSRQYCALFPLVVAIEWNLFLFSSM